MGRFVRLFHGDLGQKKHRAAPLGPACHGVMPIQDYISRKFSGHRGTCRTLPFGVWVSTSKATRSSKYDVSICETCTSGRTLRKRIFLMGVISRTEASSIGARPPLSALDCRRALLGFAAHVEIANKAPVRAPAAVIALERAAYQVGPVPEKGAIGAGI